MGPVEVHNVLILRVVPVIGHEIRVIAHRRKIAAAANPGKLKFGPAAFELARAIRSRDTQHIETDILAEPGLLRIGPLLRKTEIGIHNEVRLERDRKSTRLNSSHGSISYAVFCLKKKKKQNINTMLVKENKEKQLIYPRTYNNSTTRSSEIYK